MNRIRCEKGLNFEEIQPMNQKHLDRFNKIWGRREFRNAFTSFEP